MTSDPTDIVVTVPTAEAHVQVYPDQPPPTGGPAMKLPDVTGAQFVGIISAIINTALAFGLTLSANQQHVLIADAGIIAALIFGDSIVQHAKAKS